MAEPKFFGQNVAIYARFSSAHQREASIDDQVRRCTEFVVREGGVVRPELVFTDAAVSGASLHRPAFERMIALVREKKVDAIVVEDQSRLSRDMADAATLYRELTYLGVAIVGVADGMDTSQRHGKLTYSIKSMLSDFYLEELRDKTLRGLEGRALAGFSTGGLPYGYRSVPELDAYGKVRGHLIQVDPIEAGVVRRVFNLYLEGNSLAAITGILSDEGVPPPRAKTRHRRQGWVTTTIRFWLRNEAYRGMWSFKERQWRKVPGTNRRLPQARPDEDVIRREYPDRRIIDEDTWVQVQARLGAVAARYTGKAKERGYHGKRSAYPLSGVLACGMCGAPMIVSRGSNQTYYRCGDAKNRHTCTNTRAIREGRVRDQIYSELEERFMAPDAIVYLRKAIAEELGRRAATVNAELDALRSRLGRTEARIASLVAFLAEGNRSPAVTTSLTDLESQAQAERGAIAALEATAEVPVVLPSPDEVLQRGLRLKELLEGDPLAAREALRQLFKGGTIRLTPQPDKTWVAEGEYFPMVLLGPAAKPPKGRDKTATPRSETEAWLSVRCAGRISGVSHGVSLPFLRQWAE